MKNMFLILSFFFFATGCHEEETQKQEETQQEEEKKQEEENQQQLDPNFIYGTWQLVESWIFLDPTPTIGTWGNVENGYTLSFSLNGKHETTQYADCMNIANDFKIESDSLTLFHTECSKNNNDYVVYKFSMEDDLLNLITISIGNDAVGCIEGCGERFKKIEEL